MWVICFYLNANKNVSSETVIRGCGRDGEREGKAVSCLFSPPALLSQQLAVVVRQVPPVPAASLCLFL